MKKYLESTKYIDWDTPAIKSQASSLASTSGELNKTIKNCFEFVRDEIKHSSDYKLDPVTCAASEVLEHKRVLPAWSKCGLSRRPGMVSHRPEGK